MTGIPDAQSGCGKLNVLLVSTELRHQPPACATDGGCDGQSCPRGSWSWWRVLTDEQMSRATVVKAVAVRWGQTGTPDSGWEDQARLPGE